MVRRRLSLREKIGIIEQSAVLSMPEMVKTFSIGLSTIYEILKKKTELTDQWVNSQNPDVKNQLRKTMHEQVNNATFEWFTAARAKNLPVSGTILQARAMKFAQKFSDTTFKASNGWLESFKRRHQLTFKAICGEANDVDNAIVENWHQKLPQIIAGYAPENIANCDETALFYRAIPHKSLQIKGEKCMGGKHSKERLSVLLCAFADGKLEKPLVIGKAEKPRCFKNIDTERFVTWRSNKKAWMTAVLMEEWLLQLNARMRAQKRNILLFMDNASSHPKMNLSNVRLVFFPPNTTSRLQPMDQCVIYTVKLHYRKRILNRLCREMDKADSVTDLCKAINVLDAIQWLAASVKAISKQCVEGAYRRAGFKFDATDVNEENDVGNGSENDCVLQSLSELMRRTECSGTIHDLITMDDEVLTESDAINEIENEEADCGEENQMPESQEDSQEVVEPIELLSSDEMVLFAERLKATALLRGNNELFAKASDCLMMIEEELSQRKPKQKTVDEFFKSNICRELITYTQRSHFC